MASYFLRKTIRPLPGVVIKAVPLPDPRVTEGFGSREKVGEICRAAGYSRVMLVTDETVFSLGLAEKVIRSFDGTGVKCFVFHKINGEPDVRTVALGRKAALSCGAEAIVALGGGAVLDSVKMIASGARLSKVRIRDLCTRFLPVPGGTLPILAIPTTAGTGAEITVGAIVTNPKNGRKCATVVVGLRVTDVILDAELTVGMPLNVTEACAIDALSHGLEGAVASVRVSPEDMNMSMECVRLVTENLPILQKDPKNADARQAMTRAALYGGNAINTQLAGYVHAFAHSIGAKYHLPHGVAIYYCLAPVMAAQYDECERAFADLARYLGLCGSVPACRDCATKRKADADAFYGYLCGFLTRVGLPSAEGIIREEDIPSLVRAITDDSINYSAPKTFKKEEIVGILHAIGRS